MGNFIFRPKKGSYKITEKGKEWLKKGKNLNLDILKKDKDFIEYKENKEKEKKKRNITLSANNIDEEVSVAPIEKIKSGVLDIEIELQKDILDRLKNSNPYYFEKIILKLFKKMGYGDFETTKKSGDGGIDGVIKQDALGLEKIYTQAKRYTINNVGERDIRGFKGAMDDGEVKKGIFVTTSDFDENARQSAKNSMNKIILISGKELANLMIKYNLGVEIKEVYEIKQINEDFFMDDEL
jgi:restriction system protein